MIYPFTASELRVVLKILRDTYGWSRKKAQISYGAIARSTGVHKRSVRNILDKLLGEKIIFVQESVADRRANLIGINKNYEEWMNQPVDNSMPLCAPQRTPSMRSTAHTLCAPQRTPLCAPQRTVNKGLNQPKTIFKTSRKERQDRPVNNGEKLKAQIIGLIKGKEEQLQAGADPREVVCAVSAAGSFELERVWGTIVQARAKRNPPGYLVSALANPKYAVADGALAIAKQEMRRFNF